MTDKSPPDDAEPPVRSTLGLWIGGFLGGGALGAVLGLLTSAISIGVIILCIVGLIFWVCS